MIKYLRQVFTVQPFFLNFINSNFRDINIHMAYCIANYTINFLVFLKLLNNEDKKCKQNSTVNFLVVSEPIEKIKINLIIENK